MPLSHPAGASGGGGADLVSEFLNCLDEQERLCHGLEDLADSLPERLNTHQAVLLVGRLRQLLQQAHHLEETAVFPALVAGQAGPDLPLRPVIERLSAEHAEDEDHAGDLEEALTAYATTGTRRDAEKIGYMMRCLFVALRRHIAFDRDHVQPLLRGLQAGRVEPS